MLVATVFAFVAMKRTVGKVVSSQAERTDLPTLKARA